MSLDITKDPFFKYALEDYAKDYGISVPKGNQIIGQKIVSILADGFNYDMVTPFKMYERNKAWPDKIPRNLITSCIGNFALGNQAMFDLVFRENETKIKRVVLRSVMNYIEDYSPNDKRLSWTTALEKLGEYDKDDDEYINPCDVLDQIDMSIYRKNLNETT